MILLCEKELRATLLLEMVPRLYSRNEQNAVKHL